MILTNNRQKFEKKSCSPLMLLETTQNNYSKIITAETQHEQLKFEKKRFSVYIQRSMACLIFFCLLEWHVKISL